ncbi:MAG: sulfatase [Candidatus Aegiribacteria sp.]
MRNLTGAAVSFFLMQCLSCGDSVEDVSRPNVILVIIDTLRADHLGCYGYHRDTSPALDSLAEAGSRWKNFQAQAPWTLPATATIFTGLNAEQHGTGRRNDGDHMLHDEVPTIPSLFSEAGYRTCGIFNVALLSRHMGFARGFDHYSCDEYGVSRAAGTMDEFLEWLDGEDDGRPFMAVLHIFDVHQPYAPPDPYGNMFFPGDTIEAVYWEITDDGCIAHPEHLEHFLSRYDGSIRWVDSQLGRLFAQLRDRGLADSTVIMVTADHGEEFLEWGWVGHGGNLYRQMLHVPLIVSGPGIAQGEVLTRPAGQMDILPTLLSLCSIPADHDFQGMDILDSEDDDERPLPASQLMFRGRMLGATPLAVVRFGNLKGLVTRRGSRDSYYMFHLGEDPGELEPMEPSPQMRDMLDHYRSTPMLWNPPVAGPLDSASVRALEDLGYI